MGFNLVKGVQCYELFGCIALKKSCFFLFKPAVATHESSSNSLISALTYHYIATDFSGIGDVH